MKNLLKLICVLSIGILGIAFAQDTIPVAPTTLEPGTWAVIIGAASSLLTDKGAYGTLKQAASSVLRSERADLISKLVFVPENLPQTPTEIEQ